MIATGAGPAAAQRAAPAGVTVHESRDRLPSFGPAASRVATDSGSTSHRRATIIGAAVGAVVGGLAGVAIGETQSAYRCVTIGPPCPRKKNHTVLYAAGGAIVGAGLGASAAYVITVKMSR